MISSSPATWGSWEVSCSGSCFSRTGWIADCGLMIVDLERQDVHCGGSGCGCSAAVLTGHLLPGMRAGRWNNILFCPTGALHSPTTACQGESIPGICHAIALSNRRPAS